MEMDDNSYRVLVGDTEGENAELFERALLCCPAFALAHRASSISELISHLAGEGNFVCKPDFCGPDLVLLDLDLSGAGSGFEALQWIQSQTDAIVSRSGVLKRGERAGLRARLLARGGWLCDQAAFGGRNDHGAHAHRRLAEEFGDRER